MKRLSVQTLKEYFYNREKSISSRMFRSGFIENEPDTDFNNGLKELWQESASSIYNQKLTDIAFEKVKRSIYNSSLPSGKPAISRYIGYITRIAAILFIPLLCATLYLLTDKKEAQINWIEVYAEYGQRKEVILPDSSIIWLNSGTHLIYPERFTDTRRVFVSGETFLHVKKDPERPFIVDTKDLSIQVYGTKFNVRSYTNDPQTEAALLEGSISLRIKGDKSKKEIFIVPGEKVAVDKKQVKLEKFDIDNYQSWRQGKYTFKDKTLQEITTELERIFNVKIVIRDKSLLKESYFVTFAQGLSLDEMLDALNINNTLKIKQDQDIIEILKKQR